MIHAAVEGLGALLAPRYSVLEELERGDLVALFPAIRPAEDRFALYQKKVKATQEKQKLLTRYLQSLSPTDLGREAPNRARFGVAASLLAAKNPIMTRGRLSAAS